MSLAKIGLQAGDKHPLWGKKFTDESKALKSKAMKNKYLSGFKSYVAKPIIQLDLKGNFIRVWESATEVQKTLGYSRKALVHALGGSERTSYGYKWIYKHKTKTKNEIADPSMCRF